MKSPEVSVVMSVHNGEDYLNESINSIINQSFENFEFIIIDDGSIDNSFQILRQAENADKRIKVIKMSENQGLSIALKRGISIAKGKYVARQDIDDYSLDFRLEIQYEYMEKHKDVHVLGSNCKVVDVYGNQLYDNTNFSKIKNHKNHLLNAHAIFCHGSAFIRSKSLSEVGGYNEYFYYSQDSELWLRFIMKGYKIHVLDEILYCFREPPIYHSKKSEYKKRYNRVINFLYNNNYDINDEIDIQSDIKTLYSEIKSDSNKNMPYNNSRYWLKLSLISIKNGLGLERTWSYISKVSYDKDEKVLILYKILHLMLLTIPPRLILLIKLIWSKTK